MLEDNDNYRKAKSFLLSVKENSCRILDPSTLPLVSRILDPSTPPLVSRSPFKSHTGF